MRLGLISDVHADALALDRALTLLERHGAERVVCMGDVVEKGDDGDGVLERLQLNTVLTVCGNHDENAVRAWKEEGVRTLSEPYVSWLAEQPRQRVYPWERERVWIVHGSPNAVDEYVFPEQIPKRLKKTLRSLEADLLLLGHTHRPMMVRWNHCWMINPGSVAGTQTRDSHTCAVLDLPSYECQFFSLQTGEEIEVRPLLFTTAELV